MVDCLSKWSLIKNVLHRYQLHFHELLELKEKFKKINKILDPSLINSTLRNYLSPSVGYDCTQDVCDDACVFVTIFLKKEETTKFRISVVRKVQRQKISTVRRVEERLSRTYLPCSY